MVHKGASVHLPGPVRAIQRLLYTLLALLVAPALASADGGGIARK
jgi:hypothetical protein